MNAKRKALIALLVTAPAPSIGAALAFHIAPGPVGNVAYALCKGVLYGMPIVWLRFVERGSLSLSPMRKGGLGIGIYSGLLLGGLVLAVGMSLQDWSHPTALQRAAAESGFDTPARYALVALYLCVVNALLEEYAFRWFLYGRCRTLLGKTPAVTLGALIFTAHHVIVLRAFFDWGLVILCSLGIFAGGIVWTWCYERYRSVWPGYVSHLIVDAAVLTIGWEMLFGF